MAGRNPLEESTISFAVGDPATYRTSIYDQPVTAEAQVMGERSVVSPEKLSSFESFIQAHAKADQQAKESGHYFSFFDTPGNDSLNVCFEWNDNTADHPSALLGSMSFSYDKDDGDKEMVFFGIYDTPYGKFVNAKIWSFGEDINISDVLNAQYDDDQIYPDYSAPFNFRPALSNHDLDSAMGFVQTAQEIASLSTYGAEGFGGDMGPAAGGDAGDSGGESGSGDGGGGDGGGSSE